MDNKYVATIASREYVKEGVFAYFHLKTVIGEYEEESGIFVDDLGNEYENMLLSETSYCDYPYAYSTLQKYDEFINKYDGLDLIDAISDYNSSSENLLYIIKIVGLKEVKVICIDMSDGEEVIENEEIELPISSKDEVPEWVLDYVNHIRNNDYSEDEMNEIKEEFLYNINNLETVVDSIDLQIESTTGKNEAKELVEKIKKNIQINDKKINIDELYNEVTKTLIAQDEPAKRMIVEIAKQYMKESNDAILLTGQTGSGKTLLMDLISKNIDVPLLKIDSTQLTKPGYKGKDIDEYLADLYDLVDGDIEKCENAIVFFDEIDKKGSHSKGDVSGLDVLYTLLKFIDGTVYDISDNLDKNKKIKINTSNMKIVLGGAFSDVYKNKDNKNIGFNINKDKSIDNEVKINDFIERGLMPDELMSRLTKIIKMNDLDENSIKKIIIKSNASELKKEIKLFKKLGVKLTPTKEYIDNLCKKAIETKTGARAINFMVNNSTWEAFSEVYDNKEKIKEVILTKETLDNPKKYIKKKNIKEI